MLYTCVFENKHVSFILRTLKQHLLHKFVFLTDNHFEEGGQVVQLCLHIAVDEGVVALPAPPEDEVLSAESLGHFHALLDLRRSVSRHAGVATRGGAQHEPAFEIKIF